MLLRISYFCVPILILLGCFISCSHETPESPEQDNPFDANNPETHGDPYNLRSETVENGIRLSWDAVDWQSLKGYSIYRQIDDGEFTRVEQVNSTTLTYTDRNISNCHRYEYYVVAYNDIWEGDRTNVSTVVEYSDPILIIEGDTITHTPTRDVSLTIQAFRAENMRICNSSDFSGSVWEPFAMTNDWQLKTGEGTKPVYLQLVYPNGDTSEVVNDSIEPQYLALKISINNNSTHTPTRHVQLEIDANGGIQMQVSNQPIQGNEQWREFAEIVEWDLATGEGTKNVYVNLRNDFLIETEASDQIEPQALTRSIIINSDSTYTNHRDITISHQTTGALQIILSNVPDSSGAHWQDCAVELDWNLTTGDGWKHVYAWFRNDFFTSIVVSDSIGIDTHVEITAFNWTSTRENPLKPNTRVTFTLQTENDAFGPETNGKALVTVDGWEDIEISGQDNGSYNGIYTITTKTPQVSNSRVTISLIDRAGNEVSEEAEKRLTAEWRPGGTERTFPLGNSDESIVMCWVPEGTFRMGSPNNEQDRRDNEGPEHEVIISDGFWLGKYELTVEQWESVMGYNPSGGEGIYPVTNISWDEIQEFELELNGAFRLPSESEWEYACRAGTQTRFYWGDDPDLNDIGDYAIYDTLNLAHVGTKQPNTWNLYDMSGNISEWCEDWYHRDYIDTPTEGSAWVMPSGTSRIRRGGFWSDTASSCRSAARMSMVPSARFRYLGFRLAKDK